MARRRAAPSQLILDAVSGKFGLDEGKLTDFIEEVNWILRNTDGDWTDWEAFEIYSDCFDPAIFWPLFSQALSFIFKHQAESPREFCLLSGPVPGLLEGLEKRQIRFLYLQLLHFFSDFKQDNEFRWWYEKGTEFPRTLEMLIDRYWIPFTHFGEIRDKLDVLPSNTDKLKLAFAEKSRVAQDLADAQYVGDEDFSEYLSTVLQQCRFEVDSLKEIVALDLESSPGSNEARDEYDSARRGLTRQLAMMLLDDLFPNIKDASKTAKAEFLELLTGFSSDGLRNKWSDYRRGNTESVNADMKKVAEWKKKLKISD